MKTTAKVSSLTKKSNYALMPSFKTVLSSDAEDQNVIKDMGKGKKNAFEVIYNKYFKYIKHDYTLKLNGDDEMAKDLTSEFFVKIYTGIDKYKKICTFSSWITRSANNFFIDYIRTKNKQSAVNTISMNIAVNEDNSGADSKIITIGDLAEKSSVGFDDTILTVEDRVIDDEKNAYIEKVIEKLGEKYRDIVKMRYYEGLSYEELSEKLDMPLGSVKAVLFRAHKMLAESLNMTVLF